MDNERKAIYERARARLSELGIGWPGGLADALSVDPQVINHWRKRGVPPAMHQRLAAVLGWSVDQLLGKAPPDDRDGWPFPNIPEHRYRRLTDAQRLLIQAAILEALQGIEAGAAPTGLPRRRRARTRAA